MKISVGKIRALFITIALVGALVSVTFAQNQTAVTPQIANPKPSVKTLHRSKANPEATAESRRKLPIKSSRKNEEFTKASFSFRFASPFLEVGHSGGGTYEKSIAVDPKVNVSLCVSEGKVKVNGWSRNEVRVFIKEGSKIGFSVVDKSRQNGKPVWIKVTGTDPAKPSAQRECIWGDVIEIDAPEEAAVNLEGKETSTAVDSIRKISVKNVAGDISIRNVTEGVSASTYEGNVDVENSDGTTMLESVSGNILVFESGPSQVGDIFTAKTHSGKISLQSIGHRQVKINSISGSVLFNGELLAGGIYDFRSSNGSVVLNIPADPPCFLSATFGVGNFESELPIKTSTEDVSPGPIKTIKGALGHGDCKLNLINPNGAIRIRKQ